MSILQELSVRLPIGQHVWLREAVFSAGRFSLVRRLISGFRRVKSKISNNSKNRPYINNSLHLARKYARIFVRGHYLFRVANSFPRA